MYLTPRLKHQESYAYLRLLWNPKEGDRVYFQNKKHKVQKVVKGKGFQINGCDEWLLPGQVLWRPAPSDFDAVLLKLQSTWEYKEALKNGRLVIGINCNKRRVTLRGRPYSILSQILALRVIDSTISININKLFESSRAEKRSIRTKEDHVQRVHILKTTESSGTS